MSDMERARRFYVRARQAIYSLGEHQQNKGWGIAKTVSRTHTSEFVNKWLNGIDKLDLIVDKLKRFQIENRDFRNLMPVMDFKDMFFYLDPPYPEESRASKNDYMHDFKEQDHIDLADIARKCVGKVMISSYDCPLMRELYGDWEMVRFPPKNNNIRKTQVQECIWMNYVPEINQLKLF